MTPAASYMPRERMVRAGNGPVWFGSRLDGFGVERRADS